MDFVDFPKWNELSIDIPLFYNTYFSFDRLIYIATDFILSFYRLNNILYDYPSYAIKDIHSRA